MFKQEHRDNDGHDTDPNNVLVVVVVVVVVSGGGERGDGCQVACTQE